MIGTLGYGGNCSTTETYADIDWSKDQKTITFTLESKNITFNALQSKGLEFDIAKASSISFDINKSKYITFNIKSHDLKFAADQFSCG